MCWMFTSCSDLCWFWCPVEMYCTHLQGEWMGRGGCWNDGVDRKASTLEVLRTYGQSQLLGRGDTTWSWANRPIQLCKGENKHVLSALSCPLLWLDKVPQTFLYNWHIFFQPIPIQPPGPSQSPWNWQYILPNIRNNNAHYTLQNPKRQSL